MELELHINGVVTSLDVRVNESLLTLLRRKGYQSVKHGCETGDCGACTVLVDGVARPSCVMLAAQAGGCTVSTVESLGAAHNLHPLQQAFADTGATQCGFCTSGMLLAAIALLQQRPNPTEAEVREALSGNLCRCTGYAKPVQAVLRAAAIMRGETVQPLHPGNKGMISQATAKFATVTTDVGQHAPTTLHVVGKAVQSRSAVKLVTGKATFTEDVYVRDSLHGRILTSPHAHAIIRAIDVSEAKALPGVHAVLTYKDVPRVAYSRVERPVRENSLRDAYCLDKVMRYVGDRVAVVAAETPAIAERALRLIQVEYDVLPTVLEVRQALEPHAQRIHAEAEAVGIPNAERNIAAHMRTEVGTIERGFAEAEVIVEGEYIVPRFQSTPIEKHAVITYFDEDEYLVIRTSAQNPHYVRRTVAQILGLSIRRIRMVKAHTGGDFGVKQEMVLEDICALLTLTTHRPVTLAYSRAEEFCSNISHEHIVRLKTGVKRDGSLVANQMIVLTTTGAYATHPLTVTGDTMTEVLELYPCSHMRVAAEVLYTNLPPSGAFGGNAALPCYFALESHMDEIAKRLHMDALELRRKNWVQTGHTPQLMRGTSNGNSALESCGLAECLQDVEERLRWKETRGHNGFHEQRTQKDDERFRYGVGVALSRYTPPATGMSGAIIKLNEDGAFDIFVGSGGGEAPETMFAQIAAEVLGVDIEDVYVHGSATDMAPVESGASPAAVFANTSGAIIRAAEQIRRQVHIVAGRLMNALPESLKIQAGVIYAPNKQTMTVAQVAQHALYNEQRQLITTAAWKNQHLPTAFAVQGVEVKVDTDSGEIHVLKAVSAVDVGLPINPLLIEGQIEGSVAQALGIGICEEVLYDQKGTPQSRNLRDYHIYTAPDMPELDTLLVETSDTALPFGMKSATEVALNGIAPALANAVADAIGVRIRHLPLTPERVLRTLHAQNTKK